MTTPSGKGDYHMYRDGDVLVCQVGTTTLGYQWRAIEDLHAMLKAHGDWMPLGSADEQKPAAEGTVEAWARAAPTGAPAILLFTLEPNLYVPL